MVAVPQGDRCADYLRQMMSALLAAFVIAYLPGAVLFRLPFDNRQLRAGLAAEERAFWAVLLSTVWSVAVVLGPGGARPVFVRPPACSQMRWYRR